jgi:hypothetical protein
VQQIAKVGVSVRVRVKVVFSIRLCSMLQIAKVRYLFVRSCVARDKTKNQNKARALRANFAMVYANFMGAIIWRSVHEATLCEQIKQHAFGESTRTTVFDNDDNPMVVSCASNLERVAYRERERESSSKRRKKFNIFSFSEQSLSKSIKCVDKLRFIYTDMS